jgi:phage baseplate assembly protein W
MAEEFIGSGWAFPCRLDGNGRIALVSREEELEQSIEIILSTAPGERPMRPEFGCSIHEHVFASADAATAGRLAYDVRVALERWEPRIDVNDIDVFPDPDDPARLYVSVTWSVRGTYDPHNLVFPFYVIPPEEPAAGGALSRGSV